MLPEHRNSNKKDKDFYKINTNSSRIRGRDCARPLKNVSIFAGFVRRQAASRWAGLPRSAGQLVRVPLKASSNFIQQTPKSQLSWLFGDLYNAGTHPDRRATKRTP
jgi:hypothetical protein